jgi:hypothetical protein
VTALVRGLALDVTPDDLAERAERDALAGDRDPESETYHAGRLAIWHGPDGPVDVVALGQDGPWVDILPDHAEVGWTVSERELSPR